MILTVSAHKLHEVTLKDNSQSWKEITVFPFFKNTGEVVRHMLVIPEGQLALWIDDLDQLKYSQMGGLTLDGLVSTLPSVNAGNIGAMETMWHYDPWWMLMEPGYKSRNWVPAAGESNCPDNFQFLFYTSDLKKVTTIVKPDASPDAIEKYTPDMLAEAREKVEIEPSEEDEGWKVKQEWPDKGSWKQF